MLSTVTPTEIIRAKAALKIKFEISTAQEPWDSKGKNSLAPGDYVSSSFLGNSTELCVFTFTELCVFTFFWSVFLA